MPHGNTRTYMFDHVLVLSAEWVSEIANFLFYAATLHDLLAGNSQM